MLWGARTGQWHDARHHVVLSNTHDSQSPPPLDSLLSLLRFMTLPSSPLFSPCSLLSCPLSPSRESQPSRAGWQKPPSRERILWLSTRCLSARLLLWSTCVLTGLCFLRKGWQPPTFLRKDGNRR